MYDVFEQLLQIHGVTPYKVSKNTGVSQSTLSDWKRGISTPKRDKLQKIADYFHVPVSYFYNDDEYQDTSNPKKGIKIPILGRVAAGIPIEAIEDVLDFEEITPEMAAKGEHFALQIKGDSMEPKISDGDVVIVRQQPDVDSGQIAIVMVNGDDATCKKYVKHENGISLVSLNPAYSPMFYTFGEIEKMPITILGRVVELRAKF